MKRIFIAIIVIVLIGVGVWYAVGNKKLGLISGPQLLGTVSYACDAGKTVDASFYAAPANASTTPDKPLLGSAKVTLDGGKAIELAQTISVEGGRYANSDESLVFLSNGNRATVLENKEEKNHVGCVAIASDSVSKNLPAVYANSTLGFSVRLPSLATTTAGANPDSYTQNQSHIYQASPTKKISGVRFTIPASRAEGTNLSKDTYISVEQIPNAKECSASLFLDGIVTPAEVTDNNVTYSVAMASNAGAGNRYDEKVYTIAETNPCVAIRYVIHSTAVQNYPEGTVKEYDNEALLKEFDSIRRTLVLSQIQG